MLDIRPPRRQQDERGSTFRSMPPSAVGRWAGGLTIAFALLLALWIVASKVHADAMMAVSLSALRLAPLLGGVAVILALIALLTRRERSWFVWLGLVPGVLMVAVVALELFRLE